MKYSLATKHIELTAADQQMLEEKLERIEKHLQPPFHARLMIRADQHHRSGNVISCTVTVTQFGTVMHAERSGKSVQDALDEALGALKTELLKHRDKRRDRR